LCAVALPDESLTADDLETVGLLGPAGGHVGLLGCSGPDGHDLGAAIVSIVEPEANGAAHLQLLVVHPEARRGGVARSLVHAAEGWARERGAAELVVGAGAPRYLFTGVDTRWTDALCCFEALGYRRTGTELDLVCPTSPSGRNSTAEPRTPATSGVSAVVVQAVRDDVGDAGLAEMVQAHHPQWAAEFAAAAAAGTVVLAREGDGGRVLGAAAHSVNRSGVIGPVAVVPDVQGAGVGRRLMEAVLAELSIAGFAQAEIAWVSTVRFYVRTCGAHVGRNSVVLRRDL
jgi:GNAT superfamily N-acetyltransferase